MEQPNLLPLSSAGTTPSTNNTPVSSVNKTLSYLNKNTSLSSSTSISSSTNNEPLPIVQIQSQQHNLNIPTTNNTNHNSNNEITSNNHNDLLKHSNQEDLNIRNNLINNLDDTTLKFNSTSNKSHHLNQNNQQQHHHQNHKTTNNLLSNSTTNLNSNKHSAALNNSSTEFDFENFSKEKLKQDFGNSSKLVESGPSMFSLSSTASLPPPTSSFSSNLIAMKPAQKSITDLTTNKTVHDQITRNSKSAAPSPTMSTKSNHLATQPTANSLSSTGSSELGSIQFSVEYVQSLQQLKIHLISASNLPACDSNGLSDPYVKLHLLPGIAKATKLRSKTIYKNLNPKFNETLQYDGINLHDLDEKTLRLTVLDEDKFGFDFIGEYRLPLKTIILNEINYFDVDLEVKKQVN